MRIHKAVAFAAGVVLVGFIGVAIAQNDRDRVTCADQPTLTGCAPSASSTSSDISVNGVFVTTVFNQAYELTGKSVTAFIVFDDKEVSCKIAGTPKTSVSGSDETPYLCEEGYVAVPASIQSVWKDWPASAVWYMIARQAVRMDEGYRSNESQAACAAAYTVSRMPGYDQPTDDNQLVAHISRMFGAPETPFVLVGLQLAKEGAPIDRCRMI